MREGIGGSEFASGDMDELVIEVSKVQHPSGLPSIEFLGLIEMQKILVVSEDLYWEGGPSEVVVPGLKATNDSEKFPIIDVVVSFCSAE